MAGDQPVEQMAQRRELLLGALGPLGLRLDLDPGRDMHRLDVEEVLDPNLGLDPADEVTDGAQIRLAGVAVPYLRREENPEASSCSMVGIFTNIAPGGLLSWQTSKR
jgi:hypothetical protein